MKRMLLFAGLCTALLSLSVFAPTPPVAAGHPVDKPKISFTFDDGSIQDMPGYSLEEWNGKLLAALDKHHLQSVLFWMGKGKTNARGESVLSAWNAAGHRIANHTFSHPGFNNPAVTLEVFEQEMLRNDAIVRQWSGFYPYFRFPYLKEGDTREKIDGFRQFLKMKGYKIGHVSIDASDWYVNGRLLDRLKKDPKADISGYKAFYLEHLYNRALYYDSLSVALNHRQIHHVLLLHHNLAAAMFLDDLIQYFKDKGWDVEDAEQAFRDPVYDAEPANVPAGESLIWALAKESGLFEGRLRYPAEDGEYEKPAMDKLGL